ncbi:unnamed protein product [Schistosoma rodhaini]|uniref:Uncharacterized protein n=1 Tax=Schistosoma rodhaini TaxID=6188 RepID=A0AA85GCW2_9TREM|nr:unnamed protein product [Schistosoma rodhaini]
MNIITSRFICIFAIILSFSHHIQYTKASSLFGEEEPRTSTTSKPKSQTTTPKAQVSGATMKGAYYTVIGSVLIATAVCRYSV